MHRRRLLALTPSALLAGCVSELALPGLPDQTPHLADGAFVMADGARLPYRDWQPDGGHSGEPWAVVLALHGFNDSRDAWEVPAPALTAAGIAVYAPDQRGFGAAPGRGLWAGTQALVDDAAAMARLLRARHPQARLILMGESMGGAVLMRLATERRAPPVDGYILVAPAVWSRAEMNFFLRGTLWLASNLVPGLKLGSAGVRVTASDNRAALVRLSTDPLTILRTRVDAVKGLVDLMDVAQASAPHFVAPALFLYGGKDELVPDRATAATWRELQADGGTLTRIAFYPNGYHLLLRDLDRAAPIGDVIAWIRDPAAPLPSDADGRAQRWLAAQH